MNKFISQYTANGTLKEFAFTFDIVQGRSVNVYITLPNNSANEDNDLLAINSYIVELTNPNAELSKGNVVFNFAPVNGSIITITPDNNTNVTVSFSNTTPLNQDNLNKAYNQQSSTISQDSENFKVSSLRYNINENEANISYNNKLKPLSDKGFWRREGSNIISQDFTSFVEEVSEEVAGSVKNQVNASASNTNLTSELASNAINTPVSGDIFKVDNDGQIIVDKTLSNVISSLAGAYWAKEWATSELQINDDYGNNGFSSKYYAALANIASTATSGLIDELYVYEPTATSKIDLIEYNSNPNEPWVDVLDNSFTVYIDGKMIQSPSAYSENGGSTGGTYSYTVDIKQNPTLVSPSSITITPSVPANTQILISRGVAQGDSSTMFATGSNYKTDSLDSKIANRDLSNVSDASINSKAVGLTGNQTIAGVKNFSVSPIVPDATTTAQAINKGQLDEDSFRKYHNFTASRAFNTNYTNSTGYNMGVRVVPRQTNPTTGYYLITVKIDEMVIDLTGWLTNSSGEDAITINFDVPKGSIYRIEAPSGLQLLMPSLWVEYINQV